MSELTREEKIALLQQASARAELEPLTDEPTKPIRPKPVVKNQQHTSKVPNGTLDKPFPKNQKDAQLPPIGGDRGHSPAPVPFTEDALASQFTEHFGDRFRYVAKWNRWLQWTGSVWQEESTHLVFDLSRAICRENSDLPGANETIKKTLAHASTVAGIVKMASSDRKHAARHDQWDRTPMRLNALSGTVELTTGEWCDHNPLDYYTKIAGTGASSETPKRWLNFLGQIFEDASMIPYIQKVCGYFLTGSTVESALFFCYGSGANGKSVFSRTLAGILGDYCREASLETFTESKNEQHPTGLAALKGARLALIRETAKNSYWNESLIKSVTGGDKVTARFMRQDFFDYVPEFKLLVNGNNKPRLRQVDEAIRRRMHLIPFSVTIPENERDPQLYEKLRAEWSAILGWMIDGCLAWQEEGLAPPESVLTATSDYLDAEDRLGLWLSERCILGPRETASSTSCYQDYQLWCQSIGEHAGSQRSFSQELSARPGITPAKKHGDKRSFIGLSLKSDRPEEGQ